VKENQDDITEETEEEVKTRAELAPGFKKRFREKEVTNSGQGVKGDLLLGGRGDGGGGGVGLGLKRSEGNWVKLLASLGEDEKSVLAKDIHGEGGTLSCGGRRVYAGLGQLSLRYNILKD
jgi:hypothetical protein